MNNDIKVIKFDNGEVVVAVVEDQDFTSLNFINIVYPIQVITEADLKNGEAIERYSLKPWLGISGETLYTINTKNIITMVNLKVNHVEGFERMVDMYYPSEERLQEILEEAEQMDDILEYLEAKNNNEIN